MTTVPFLDVAGAARWITDSGPESLLVSLTSALEVDFARWEEFALVPRLAMHSPGGVIELMPVSDGTWYSFKYVNGHPRNPSHGLQTVTAFGVVAEVSTGYPVFVAEMTLLTALRTAATSALAALHLARPDSRVMAMIGTGSQAEFQALAMGAALGIDRLRVYDTDPAAMTKFASHMRPLGFDVHLAADAQEATVGADVITTCTADKALATVLTAEMVAPGTHVNAIGGDCPGKTELSRELLERATVFCELEEQTRIEGEMQQMPDDFAVTELWEVLTGRAPGRTRPGEVTVFDSVGFALEDFTVLRLAQAATADSPWLRHLDLVASPDDPKDLFGLINTPAPEATLQRRVPGRLDSCATGRAR